MGALGETGLMMVAAERSEAETVSNVRDQKTVSMRTTSEWPYQTDSRDHTIQDHTLPDQAARTGHRTHACRPCRHSHTRETREARLDRLDRHDRLYRLDIQ